MGQLDGAVRRVQESLVRMCQIADALVCLFEVIVIRDGGSGVSPVSHQMFT